MVVIPCSIAMFDLSFYIASLIALLWLFKRLLITLRPSKRYLRPGARVAVIGGGIAGCAASWSLKRQGYHPIVIEKRPVLGGNAKVHTWGNGVTTGLSVLAWPALYFRNYNALLRQLQVPVETVQLPFFINTPRGTFSHHGDSDLHRLYQDDFIKWRRLVSVIRTTTGWLCQSKGEPSFYFLSLLNPFNILPLRWAVAAFGISTGFWKDIIVPIYSSSFLTTELTFIPSVIVPILEDLIPLNSTPEMLTWSNNSSEVFAKMMADVEVRLSTEVTAHRVGVAAKHDLGLSDGTNLSVEAVVYACNAPNAARCLPASSWLARWLLSRLAYVDHNNTAFQQGVIHSDGSVIPADLEHSVFASKHANYIEAQPTEDGSLAYENTFIVGSWVPAAQRATKKQHMLVTYNSSKTISDPQGEVDNSWAHPQLNPVNSVWAVLLQFVQGRDNQYFCGSYATPGNGHDLSFISGLAVAECLGAEYPFPANMAARVDFGRLKVIMGLD
eukprot:m.163684 g.163684  ORF g.163684 m.163684 type:complete len:498 (+) comp16558_c0_seq1:2542-4035(+)